MKLGAFSSEAAWLNGISSATSISPLRSCRTRALSSWTTRISTVSTYGMSGSQ
jgi:hypothetical protein